MTQEEIDSLRKQILHYLLKPKVSYSWFALFVIYLQEKDLLDDFQSFVDRTIEGNQ